MRICFFVRSPQHQEATFTTVELAHEASLRGHEVSFVSVSSVQHKGDRFLGEAFTLGPQTGSKTRGFLEELLKQRVQQPVPAVLVPRDSPIRQPTTTYSPCGRVGRPTLKI